MVNGRWQRDVAKADPTPQQPESTHALRQKSTKTPHTHGPVPPPSTPSPVTAFHTVRCTGVHRKRHKAVQNTQYTHPSQTTVPVLGHLLTLSQFSSPTAGVKTTQPQHKRPGEPKNSHSLGNMQGHQAQHDRVQDVQPHIVSCSCRRRVCWHELGRGFPYGSTPSAAQQQNQANLH